MGKLSGHLKSKSLFYIVFVFILFHLNLQQINNLKLEISNFSINLGVDMNPLIFLTGHLKCLLNRGWGGEFMIRRLETLNYTCILKTY